MSTPPNGSSDAGFKISSSDGDNHSLNSKAHECTTSRRPKVPEVHTPRTLPWRRAPPLTSVLESWQKTLPKLCKYPQNQLQVVYHKGKNLESNTYDNKPPQSLDMTTPPSSKGKPGLHPSVTKKLFSEPVSSEGTPSNASISSQVLSHGDSFVKYPAVGELMDRRSTLITPPLVLESNCNNGVQEEEDKNEPIPHPLLGGELLVNETGRCANYEKLARAKIDFAQEMKDVEGELAIMIEKYAKEEVARTRERYPACENCLQLETKLDTLKASLSRSESLATFLTSVVDRLRGNERRLFNDNMRLKAAITALNMRVQELIDENSSMCNDFHSLGDVLKKSPLNDPEGGIFTEESIEGLLNRVSFTPQKSSTPTSSAPTLNKTINPLQRGSTPSVGLRGILKRKIPPSHIDSLELEAYRDAPRKNLFQSAAFGSTSNHLQAQATNMNNLDAAQPPLSSSARRITRFTSETPRAGPRDHLNETYTTHYHNN